MAPEVVKQVAYTKKADIWSVGCLIVEMLTGEHPWAQLNQMQAIFKVLCLRSFLTPLSLTNVSRCRSVLLLRNPQSPLTFRLTPKASWTSASNTIMKFGHLREIFWYMLG